MAAHRPFPPSPRRRALARAAGLTAASPVVGGVAAWLGALVAVLATGRAAALRLGDALAAACSGSATAALTGTSGAGAVGGSAAGSLASSAAGSLGSSAAGSLASSAAGSLASSAAGSLGVMLVKAVLGVLVPILAAAAVAAALAHVAQTRALWLPRRALPGAPALDTGAGVRVSRTARDLAAAAIAIGVAIAWTWLMAPRLARLLELDAPALLGAFGALLASAAVAVAIAAVVIASTDALVAHAAHARALAMSAEDKREDDRLAGADPRWRERRAAIARGPASPDVVAGASVLVLGDDLAIAIAWDPIRRPIPTRLLVGRRARATQMLGLARRYRVPVQRDPALAAALGAHDGPVPEASWPRVAELIAAVRRA